jgi:hypothetical protein
MKEIKLEVTQKISQNENVKLGSLQNSTTPTLLGSIQQLITQGSDPNDELSFFAANPVTPQADNFLAAANESGLLLELGTEPKKLLEKRGKIYALQPWGPYLLVFKNHMPLQFIGQDGTVAHRTAAICAGYPSWTVYTTETHVYFRNDQETVTAVDGAFTETTFDAVQQVSDFSVGPGGRPLTILSLKGTLIQGNQTIQLPKLIAETWFPKIKQMYSDHFLVAEFSLYGRTNQLQLLDSKTLETVHKLDLSKEAKNFITHIRLLRPRMSIQPMLATAANFVYLVTEYCGKLHKVGSHNDEYGNYSICSFIGRWMWILAQQGCKITGLRIHFPECLQY